LQFLIFRNNHGQVDLPHIVLDDLGDLVVGWVAIVAKPCEERPLLLVESLSIGNDKKKRLSPDGTFSVESRNLFLGTFFGTRGR
jgi:hypothetical protein